MRSPLNISKLRKEAAFDLSNLQKYQNNQRLSGPVSAYVTEINGKRYEFFGDSHYSISGGCSKPCQDINDLIKGVDLSDPQGCWDISVFLSALFTQAAKEGKWIDFYLETPYFKEDIPDRNLVRKEISRVGHLKRLFYVFYTCFTKTDCEYSTTRFHYVDLRLLYNTIKLPQLVKFLYEMIWTTDTETNPYEMYLGNKIKNTVNILEEMSVNNITTRNREVEETSLLVKDFFFSGERDESKYKTLFKLYITSDNIYEDVKSLMENSLKMVRDPLTLMEILLPSKLIVNRNGKNMHRTRAQLGALEKEGKRDISEKIVRYLIEEFSKRDVTNMIMNIWKSIENSYNAYINNKIKYMNIPKLGNMLYFKTTSLLMDAYVLGRMFRTFPGKKHVDSSKSIVYAGYAHIETYVNFFEKYMGATFLENNPNPNIETMRPEEIKRCLSISTKNF